MINVLYVHHAGVFGGASRSLLELILAFPEKKINPVVLVPPGAVDSIFKKNNIKTVTVRGLSQFDNTSYSYYRNWRWLITIREIFLLPYTFYGFVKARREIGIENIDIVHVNEITNIPSVIFSKIVLRKPVVLHVRSLQRSPNGFRNKLIYKIIQKLVAKSIAIDHTVGNSLHKEMPVDIIHNGFFINSSINEGDLVVSESIGKLSGRLKIVMVGSLLYMKGIEDFMEAARMCKSAGMEIDFILVGDKPNNSKGIIQRVQKILGLSHDAKQFVYDFIEQHLLQGYVHLFPFTTNIASVYSQCDIVCFPSHLNAVGRPVFEGALLGKPSIVAIENPQPDTIINMETGLCIPKQNPDELFKAIEYFYNQPEEVERMGQGALALANRYFNIKSNALRVLDIYSTIIKSKFTGRV